MTREFWNERFGSDEYAYGTAPNTFIAEEADRIPPGRVLCLAEGEGRNAVFLATRGHTVTAVDFSRAGLEKTERLARARGVTVELVEADLATYVLPQGAFAGIVSVYAHVPPEVRRRIHKEVTEALQPGGVFLLEGYSVGQLERSTGGPKDKSLLLTVDEVQEELQPLETPVAREVDRDIQEGRFHSGLSLTVQIVAVRSRGLGSPGTTA
ncbi:MAG: class I SAM-dependent methyltransferase [Deltaproteobacteria bacterium]|nr:class I SAM-dependent methyltransferase [Deltaproteobacteria bacterium]